MTEGHGGRPMTLGEIVRDEDKTAGILPEGTLEMLQEASVLRLQPGDIVVLRTPDQMSSDTARALCEYAEGAFPGHKVVVLTAGLWLGVVRPEQAP